MSTTEDGGRFAWLEDPGRDFPYFRGQPVALTAWQWLLVMAAVGVGFMSVALPFAWPGGMVGGFVPAILLFVIPLGALAFVAGSAWRALFGRVSGREIKWMVLFALLNIVVTLCVGAVVTAFVEVEANAAIASVVGLDTAGRVLFLVKIALQLLGEEVISILPFLALLTLFTRRFGASRRGAIVGAWLLSALLFGLAHLPTYGWNLVQCIVIIGTARLVLTLPWIITKNLWVSTGAHVLNDWALMSMGLLGSTLAGQT
ncbi:CPBP family intramembrane metalloprotease [Roseomonas sp. PWR1]|uniref:CPBP family intramembrane metalloprotease n=1 Tax=Roseomonas nitratireducens TaxID=2820810 RepID=A0ABS4AWH3_9PROT|nr:CPBP family intramembrane metalloprotease [Neoroseomonas nitratireducens]